MTLQVISAADRLARGTQLEVRQDRPRRDPPWLSAVLCTECGPQASIRRYLTKKVRMPMPTQILPVQPATWQRGSGSTCPEARWPPDQDFQRGIVGVLAGIGW
jgi:hypothetical protein